MLCCAYKWPHREYPIIPPCSRWGTVPWLRWQEPTTFIVKIVFPCFNFCATLQADIPVMRVSLWNIVSLCISPYRHLTPLTHMCLIPGNNVKKNIWWRVNISRLSALAGYVLSGIMKIIIATKISGLYTRQPNEKLQNIRNPTFMILSIWFLCWYVLSFLIHMIYRETGT